MKKTFRWILWIGGGLLATILIALVSLHFIGKARLAKAPDVVTHPVTAAAGADAIARGEYLAKAVSLCSGCHGDNLEGQVFFEGELGSYVFAPNLTSGMGGIGATYTDGDWERAIRHGIGRDGRVLVIMPSNQYSFYNNSDLSALIAYLKQVPPMDNDLGQRKIGFPGSVLGGTIGFNDFTNINTIDHPAVGNTPDLEPAETAAYGEYLTHIAGCRDCHGEDLGGVPDDPDFPGPNLTPDGDLGNWTVEDFINTIHSGRTPENLQLDSDLMPWPKYAQMTNSDLTAIWEYLHSLAPIPTSVDGG